VEAAILKEIPVIWLMYINTFCAGDH